MAQVCANCGAEMPEISAFCPACGKPVEAQAAPAPPAEPAQVGGMGQNLAGMLAYLTFVPAIILLVVDPYNRNRFIRFHAFQSIFFELACATIFVGISILGMLPLVNWVALFILPVVALATFIVWLILVIKAYQGQMFKLPGIGDMAQTQAEAQ